MIAQTWSRKSLNCKTVVWSLAPQFSYQQHQLTERDWGCALKKRWIIRPNRVFKPVFHNYARWHFVWNCVHHGKGVKYRYSPKRTRLWAYSRKSSPALHTCFHRVFASLNLNVWETGKIYHRPTIILTWREHVKGSISLRHQKRLTEVTHLSLTYVYLNGLNLFHLTNILLITRNGKIKRLS